MGITNYSKMAKTKEQEIKECLDAVNAYRADHGADDCILDQSLCDQAEEYAKELCELGKLEHSDRSERPDQGENLVYWGGKRDKTTAIDMWYSEVNDYDFKNPGYPKTPGKCIGHFTQIVWKDSKKFGIGWATDEKGHTYVCGRFEPCGNMTMNPPGKKVCWGRNVGKPDIGLVEESESDEFEKFEVKRCVKNEEKFESLLEDDKKTFFDRLTQIRLNHQVEPLIEDPVLNEAAQSWAEQMAKFETSKFAPKDNKDGASELICTFFGP